MQYYCVVTHTDELVLGQCLASVRDQNLPLLGMEVISGLSPASAAFNAALDRAAASGADVLIHLAADVILQANAFKNLVKRLRDEQIYAVVANGFDIINGFDAPAGLWALKIAAVGDIRFRDVFKMDLDFCERVEAATGMKRTKTRLGKALAYHHPIWTAEELFRKFRYNAAKYPGKVNATHLRRLTKFLEKNPENKALRAGLIGLKRGMSEPAVAGSPNRDLFREEWADVTKLLGGVDPSDFFAYHAEYIELGYRLLGQGIPINSMETSLSGNGRRIGKKGLKPTLREQMQLYRRRIIGFFKSRYGRLPEPTKRVLRSLRPGRASKAKVLPSLPSTLSGVHPGNKAGQLKWAEKWSRAPRERRILMVAPKDFAGSMFKWAESVNAHTDYAVRLVTFERHQYGYPVDLVLGEISERDVVSLADEAALLHLKDEHSWFMNLPMFKSVALIQRLFFSSEFHSTPKAFTNYGGYARKFKADPAYIEAVTKFDLRIAMTPDLNYEWFAGEYIPHNIDVDNFGFEWSDNHVLAHSPSTQEKKGTYLLEEASMLLDRFHQDVWAGWSLDLIHGVSYEACLARKRKAALFYDQAGRHSVAALGIDELIGWYGNSAIEAMAFGIPTIAHLAEHSFEGAERAGVYLRDTPMINIMPNRTSLLKAVTDFASLDPAARLDLAQRTRQFAVDFHGYAPVARRLAQAYDGFIGASQNSRGSNGHDRPTTAA